MSRYQSFLVGAMVYMECLASFIFDQPIDALDYLQRFGAFAQGQRIYPNPWTGVSTPLFVCLAETAILMRAKRKSDTSPSWRQQPMANAGSCQDLNRKAKSLYERTLNYCPPPITAMEETKDFNTPVNHLVSIDTAHRLVILMELIQKFPELAVEEERGHTEASGADDETDDTVFDCAIAILTVVCHLPESSGANVMLSIPLISAASALRTKKPKQRFDLAQGRRHALGLSAFRSSISAVMQDQRMLSYWRGQVTSRLECTHRRVGVAPLRLADQLVKQVWHCADVAAMNDRPGVHWMDVMIERNLETLFG